MKAAAVALIAFTIAAQAQESKIHSDFRREGEELKQNCRQGGMQPIFECVQTIFSGYPLHIAMGSIAPQNGFGTGLAFVEHTALERWRLSWNADAVGSTNASWRAGVYMKAIYATPTPITVDTDTPGHTAKSNLVVREYPVMNAYAQTTSLNTINYFGMGPTTSRSSEALFGIRETIVGANAILPVVPRWNLSVFGELNGRFVDIRDSRSSSTPSISQTYTDATAPGLVSQPAFFQAGEGIRLRPELFADHFQLNYQVTYQQFVAPGSRFSFQRFTADLGHQFPLYGRTQVAARDTNGPDECGSGIRDRKCPVVMNRSGSIGLRLLISESFTSGGNIVPFYFQPTLGGSDINGNQLLPSYHDYRFRAPNLLLFRASFEHSIYGPLGLQFMFDTGKVAAKRGDIDFNHLAHSFAGGLTLRAGGIPAVSLLFTTGTEGSHNILMMSNSLLGGSARPSLF
jgi:hypothetical protein